MLAGLPGQVGDGEKVTLNYTKADGSNLAVTTYVGKKANSRYLEAFLGWSMLLVKLRVLQKHQTAKLCS